MARLSVRIVLLGAVSALAGACTHTPAGLAGGDVPPAWQGPAAQSAPEASRNWWNGFDSYELSALLVQAEASSFDVQTAALRVIEAEARAQSAGATLWPRAGFSASANRRGDFQNSPKANSYSASASLSYEADLWGRLRANRRGALAALAASRYDRATVGIDTAAGVAGTYFQVLALRDRLKTARANLDIAEQVLRIVTSRVNAGAAPPLDLRQQEAAVAQQRSTIPPLEQQEREALASLALLLGRSATGFKVATLSLGTIALPSVAPGLPADLLRRRPDIASAEANLTATAADTDAARASFLPSIELTSSTGVASAALKTLLEPASAAWSIGASVGQAIFDAGARDADLKGARAREQEAWLAYRQTVLTAFSEVDLALSDIQALAQQRADRETQVAAAREAYRIAQIRYREGVDNLEATLQAQSALFGAEDSLTQIKLAQAQAAITLFRALGGGWQRAATTPS